MGLEGKELVGFGIIYVVLFLRNRRGNVYVGIFGIFLLFFFSVVEKIEYKR